MTTMQTSNRGFKKVNDWRGTPILPGCRVIYPGRREGKEWVSEGIVIRIIDTMNTVGTPGTELRVQRLRTTADWDAKGEVTLKRLGNVTVIEPADPNHPTATTTAS